MPSVREDVGPKIVNYVYRRLKVDDQWSVRKQRGFRWWSGPLQQTIWAEPAMDDDGIVICRVLAVTDFLTNVSFDAESMPALGFLSSVATVSGLVRARRDQSQLQWMSAVVAHGDSLEWLQDWFTWVCAIQVSQAHILAHHFDGTLGELAVSAHPENGQRTEPDDITDFVPQLVIPTCAGESQWIGNEFDEIAAGFRQQSIASSSSREGLTAEIPWPMPHGVGLGESSTALWEMSTAERNPLFNQGAGLFTSLTLPTHYPNSDDVDLLALELNEWERDAGRPTFFLGGWAMREFPTLRMPCFVSFFPNCLHRPLMPMNFSSHARRRAKNVHELLI